MHERRDKRGSQFRTWQVHLYTQVLPCAGAQISLDCRDAPEKDFAVPRQSMNGGAWELMLYQSSKILNNGSDNAQAKF